MKRDYNVVSDGCGVSHHDTAPGAWLGGAFLDDSLRDLLDEEVAADERMTSGDYPALPSEDLFPGEYGKPMSYNGGQYSRAERKFWDEGSPSG